VVGGYLEILKVVSEPSSKDEGVIQPTTKKTTLASGPTTLATMGVVWSPPKILKIVVDVVFL
jgi:hypothetical protein